MFVMDWLTQILVLLFNEGIMVTSFTSACSVSSRSILELFFSDLFFSDLLFSKSSSGLMDSHTHESFHAKVFTQ